jgi:hypothetical protein
MNTPQINDGGPAFPCEEQIRCNGEVIDFRKFTGMTLRDWFAGQALVGLVSLQRPDAGITSDSLTAYVFADAMLKAREVKP